MVLVRQRLREVCYVAMNMPLLGLCSLESHGKAFPLQVMNTQREEGMLDIPSLLWLRNVRRQSCQLYAPPRLTPKEIHWYFLEAEWFPGLLNALYDKQKIICSIEGMILTEKQRNTRGPSCCNITLSFKSPTGCSLKIGSNMCDTECKEISPQSLNSAIRC